MRFLISSILLILLYHAPAAVARTAYICETPATTGSFSLSDDCTLSGEVILTGDLDILGVPKPDGSYPVITAAALYRHFTITSGAPTLRLKYLKMTGADIAGITSSDDRRAGGSIFVNNVAAHLNVSHCVFFNNRAYYGGAVYASIGQSNLFFSSVLFDTNDATNHGGAVYLINGPSFVGLRNIYTRNTAGGGGAMFLHSGTSTVSSYSHFKDNTATDRGGGIYLYGSTSSPTQLTLTRVVLEENKQTNGGTVGFYGGGGLHLSSKVTVNIRECTFIRNEATTSGSNGGKNGHQIQTFACSGIPSITIVNTNFTDLPGSHPFWGYDCSDDTFGPYVSPTTCASNPCTIEPFTGACATHPFGASNGLLCDYDSSITCSSGLYSLYNKIINSTSLLPPPESACGCSGFTPLGGVCTAFTVCTADQYETTPATATSDRQCTPLTVCTADKYESTPATTTSDRQCTLLTVCTADKYESTPATTTSDRQCTAYTVICSGTEYESSPRTSTSDRQCTPLTVCTAEEYETAAATATSDRQCTALTTCTSEEYESIAPTSTSDRKCLCKTNYKLTNIESTCTSSETQVTILDDYHVTPEHRPVDIAFADANGDGHKDAFVAYYATNKISVYLMDATGQILSTLDITRNQPLEIAVADFDGDNHVDVLVLDDNRKINLHKGDGTGSFEETGTQTYSGADENLHIVDIDSDNDMDVLFRSGTYLRFQLNNGDGTFGTSMIVTNAAGGAYGGSPTMTTADFNNDGHIDIGICEHHYDSLYAAYIGAMIYLNDGTSSSFTKVQVDKFDYCNGKVASGDLNGDGKVEMLYSHRTNGLTIIEHSSGNTFTTTTLNADITAKAESNLIVVDYDNNGAIDVLGKILNQPGLTLLSNNGDGSFTSSSVLSDLFDKAVVLDVDGSGNLDIFYTQLTDVAKGTVSSSLCDKQCTACPLNSTRLAGDDPLLGVTTECCSEAFQNSVGASCTAFTDISNCNPEGKKIIYGTANSDAYCEACLAEQYASDTECKNLTVCTSEEYESVAPTLSSDRVCTALTVCNSETQYESIAATATSDRTCLCKANNHAVQNHCFLETNAVSLLDGYTEGLVTPEHRPVDIALADANGDGHKDAFVAYYATNKISVYLMDATGQILSTLDITRNQPLEIAVADFDGDNHVDVLVLDDNRKINLHKGDGTGSFEETGTQTYSGADENLHIVDIDSDNDMDVLFRSGTYLRFQLNNGDGTFGTSMIVTNAAGGAYGGSPTMTTADFNNDGHIDIGICDYHDDYIFADYNGAMIYLNDGTSSSFTRVKVDKFDYCNGKVASGDLNGDGKVEMLYSHRTNGLTIIEHSSGNTFTTTTLNADISAKAESNLIVVDYDNNGAIDVLGKILNQPGLTLLSNNGDGSFTSSSVLSVWFDKAVVLDVDGSGSSDVFYTSSLDTAKGILNSEICVVSGCIACAEGSTRLAGDNPLLGPTECCSEAFQSSVGATCTAFTVCLNTQYESVAPNASKDRQCIDYITSCPAGAELSAALPDAQRTCEACPIGEYKTLNDGSACLPCQDAYEVIPINATEGATDCVACDVTTEYDHDNLAHTGCVTTTNVCPVNFQLVVTAGNSPNLCEACSPGTEQLEADSTAQCKACAEGYFSSNGHACTAHSDVETHCYEEKKKFIQGTSTADAQCGDACPAGQRPKGPICGHAVCANEPITIHRTEAGHPLRLVSEADCEGKGCKAGSWTSLPTSSVSGWTTDLDDSELAVSLPEGLYFYVCTSHANMVGAILVEDCKDIVHKHECRCNEDHRFDGSACAKCQADQCTKNEAAIWHDEGTPAQAGACTASLDCTTKNATQNACIAPYEDGGVLQATTACCKIASGATRLLGDKKTSETQCCLGGFQSESQAQCQTYLSTCPANKELVGGSKDSDKSCSDCAPDKTAENGETCKTFAEKEFGNEVKPTTNDGIKGRIRTTSFGASLVQKRKQFQSIIKFLKQQIRALATKRIQMQKDELPLSDSFKTKMGSRTKIDVVVPKVKSAKLDTAQACDEADVDLKAQPDAYDINLAEGESGLICSGSDPITKLEMTREGSLHGEDIDVYDYACWDGSAWSTAVEVQSGADYVCDGMKFYVNSLSGITCNVSAPVSTADASVVAGVSGADCGATIADGQSCNYTCNANFVATSAPACSADGFVAATCECPAGHSDNLDGTCTPCAANAYAVSAGSTTCTLHSVQHCPAGQFFTAGDALTADSATCTACAEGEFQADSDSTATSCLPYATSQAECDARGGGGFIAGTGLAERDTCLPIWNEETSGMFYVQDITLTSSTLVLTGSLTLYGNESSYASSPTTITALQSGNRRHFYYDYSVVGTLTLKHLKLTGGYGLNGGSIRMGGYSHLHATYCKFDGNNAVMGGAIFHPPNTPATSISLFHCEVTNNEATGDGGGGIFSHANTHIEGCIIADNTAYTRGGGVYYGKRSLTIVRSEIRDNTQTGTEWWRTGGGLHVDGAVSSVVTIRESSFVNNEATSSTNGHQISVQYATVVPSITVVNTKFDNSGVTGGEDFYLTIDGVGQSGLGATEKVCADADPCTVAPFTGTCADAGDAPGMLCPDTLTCAAGTYFVPVTVALPPDGTECKAHSTACEAGEFVGAGSEDADTCEDCPAGSAQALGDFSGNECTLCAADTHTTSEGQATCDACPADRHGYNTTGTLDGEAIGATACACDSGSYDLEGTCTAWTTCLATELQLAAPTEFTDRECGCAVDHAYNGTECQACANATRLAGDPKTTATECCVGGFQSEIGAECTAYSEDATSCNALRRPLIAGDEDTDASCADMCTGWMEVTSTGAAKGWRGITSSADGTKLAAGVWNGNIWTSSDSGATWTEVTSTGETKKWYVITSSEDGAKIAAAPQVGNIWTSSDSGASWTERHPTNSDVSWSGITSSADGTKLAACGMSKNIYTSDDSGATWTTILSTGGEYWYDITSSADGTKLAAVVDTGNIWTSSDSGATWTEVTTTGVGKQWRKITSSADGTKLAAVVKNGNIWTSDDSGASWTEDTSVGETKDWRAITSSSDGTKLAAAVGSGNIWTSSNSGATWTEDTSVGDGTGILWDITSSSDGTMVVGSVYAGNIWKYPADAPTHYASGTECHVLYTSAPAGYELIENGNNFTQHEQRACAIGTYSALTDASACIVCEDGYEIMPIGTESNATGCEVCDVATEYDQDGLAHTGCIETLAHCPAGFQHIETNSTSPNICEYCPDGTFQPKNNTLDQCQPYATTAADCNTVRKKLESAGVSKIEDDSRCADTEVCDADHYASGFDCLPYSNTEASCNPVRKVLIHGTANDQDNSACSNVTCSALHYANGDSCTLYANTAVSCNAQRLPLAVLGSENATDNSACAATTCAIEEHASGYECVANLNTEASCLAGTTRVKGAEFLLSNHSTSHQNKPALAALQNGNLVAVWMSDNQDTEDWGIFGRLYDEQGTAIADEFQINSHFLDEQSNPAVAALSDGSFVVVWRSNNQDADSWGVYQQRYSPSGNKLGGEELVNSEENDAQQDPHVAALDGSYVVVWQSARQHNPTTEIFLQRYDNAGTTLGSEQVVNTYKDGSQLQSNVAALTGNKIVVLWEGEGENDVYGIFAKVYDSSANVLKDDFLVNNITAGYQEFVEAKGIEEGGFVAAWKDGSNLIYARAFDSSFEARGDNFVLQSSTNRQEHVSLEAIPDGGFLAAWQERDPATSTYDIMAKRFTKTLTAQDDAFIVNDHTNNQQKMPSLALLSNNQLFIAWQSKAQDNTNYESIYARQYTIGEANSRVIYSTHNNSDNSACQACLQTEIASGEACFCAEDHYVDGGACQQCASGTRRAGDPKTSESQCCIEGYQSAIGGGCIDYSEDASSCNAQRQALIEGTRSQDAACAAACLDTQYASGTQCIDYITTCPIGQELSEALNDTQRFCQNCSAGHYKSINGSSACLPHTTCLAGTEVQIGAPSNEVDRVCGCAEDHAYSGTECQTCASGTRLAGDPKTTGATECCVGGYQSAVAATCTAYSEDAQTCNALRRPLIAGDEDTDASCGALCNATTEFAQATQCVLLKTACPAGQDLQGASNHTDYSCTLCAAGLYKKEADGSQCIACQDGFETVPLDQNHSAIDCIICDKATEYDDDGLPHTVCIATHDKCHKNFQLIITNETKPNYCEECSPEHYQDLDNTTEQCKPWTVCDINSTEVELLAPSLANNRVCGCELDHYVEGGVCKACAERDYGIWTEVTTTGLGKSWWSITSSPDGTKLVAGTGNMWRSTDSGTTWTELTIAGATSWQGVASSDDGTKLAAVAFNGNIWTSDDSGTTWTASGPTKLWQDITSSADGTKLAAVETRYMSDGNVWISSNSGVTWTSVQSTSGHQFRKITSSADGTKLAAIAYNGNIWISSDSGATWTQDNSVGEAKLWHDITSSADGTKLAAVALTGNIWISTNSGATWTEDTSVGATKSWNGITSSADGTNMAAVAFEGIWTSTDSGATWIEDTSVGETTNWKGITSSADGTKLAATVYGGNIWTKTPVYRTGATRLAGDPKTEASECCVHGYQSAIAAECTAYTFNNTYCNGLRKTLPIGERNADNACGNTCNETTEFAQGTECVPYITSCGNGTYLSEENTPAAQKQCLPCPAGTYKDFEGAGACVACAAGSEVSEAKDQCNLCPTENRFDDDQDSSTVCAPAVAECNKGTELIITDAVTDNSCDACPLGRFQDQDASTNKCQPFTKNATYCNALNRKLINGNAQNDAACSADLCLEGEEAVGEKCLCKENHRLLNGICTACAEGFFRDKGDDKLVTIENTTCEESGCSEFPALGSVLYAIGVGTCNGTLRHEHQCRYECANGHQRMPLFCNKGTLEIPETICSRCPKYQHSNEQYVCVDDTAYIQCNCTSAACPESGSHFFSIGRYDQDDSECRQEATWVEQQLGQAVERPETPTAMVDVFENMAAVFNAPTITTQDEQGQTVSIEQNITKEEKREQFQSIVEYIKDEIEALPDRRIEIPKEVMVLSDSFKESLGERESVELVIPKAKTPEKLADPISACEEKDVDLAAQEAAYDVSLAQGDTSLLCRGDTPVTKLEKVADGFEYACFQNGTWLATESIQHDQEYLCDSKKFYVNSHSGVTCPVTRPVSADNQLIVTGTNIDCGLTLAEGETCQTQCNANYEKVSEANCTKEGFQPAVCKCQKNGFSEDHFGNCKQCHIGSFSIGGQTCQPWTVGAEDCNAIRKVFQAGNATTDATCGETCPDNLIAEFDHCTDPNKKIHCDTLSWMYFSGHCCDSFDNSPTCLHQVDRQAVPLMQSLSYVKRQDRTDCQNGDQIVFQAGSIVCKYDENSSLQPTSNPCEGVTSSHTWMDPPHVRVSDDGTTCCTVELYLAGNWDNAVCGADPGPS